MADTLPCTVIVLAAQRTGVVNPLAKRAGVSHKCVVPIQGKPLIVHVMDVLAALPAFPRVRISVEAEVHEELRGLLMPYAAKGMDIDFIASNENIAESVLNAAENQSAPYVITTADNVLLTREAFEATLAAMDEADVVMNLASQASVKAVHPESQRRFYEFRDGGYANCNLYGIAGPHAFASAEVFREGGQFMKNPGRLIRAFGLFNILLFRMKVLTLDAATKRISRKFGLRFRAIVPPDGSQAVDVDNERTYGVAELVLERRAEGKPSTG